MPLDPAKGGPNDRERLEHMLNAAKDVHAFCIGRSITDLDKDAMFRRAMINAVQVIGEAAARVTESGRARVPGLPWGKIVASRNILVHAYWGVTPSSCGRCQQKMYRN